MNTDFWKSKPAEGAVERDLTGAVLMLNVTNSIGEKFQFEITKKNENASVPPKYGNTGWGEKCQLDIVLNIF